MTEHVEFPGPIVSGEWLATHLDEVVVLDARWYLDGRSGRAAYDGGHVPTAQWIDLDIALSAPADPALGRHPLPPASQVVAALGSLGVDERQPVVVYDDASGSIAARAWWLLRQLGQPVAVLDGGIRSWPGELSTERVTAAPVVRPPVEWPDDRFLSIEEVEPHLAVDGAVLLDARAASRYAQGDPQTDPRPGHIPGARSAPWMANLDPSSGHFLPAEQLAARFEALGIVDGTPVAAYCGSGVTACHDLLALTIAGVTSTQLYTGSWSQWGADDSRPTATGADEG
jgi:thiosulfate/3-mercaptopyruvate sulfurtransferase